MDFPKSFRTGIQNLIIDSARWRGLAVQCKSSGLFRSIRGTGEDEIHAATGSQFSDRDIGMHIILKPMKTVRVHSVANATAILPQLPGVRYYIHSVILSASMIVTDTGTYYGVDFTQNGVSVRPDLAFVTLTAGRADIAVVLDMITDPNTVVISYQVGTFSAGSITVNYAEVGAS